MTVRRPGVGRVGVVAGGVDGQQAEQARRVPTTPAATAAPGAGWLRVAEGVQDGFGRGVPQPGQDLAQRWPGRRSRSARLIRVVAVCRAWWKALIWSIRVSWVRPGSSQGGDAVAGEQQRVAAVGG